MNATAAQALTVETAAKGVQVRFRPEFSADLDGIVFEIYHNDGQPVTRTEYETGLAFLTLRRRVGKQGRWNYRLARVRDLLVVA